MAGAAAGFPVGAALGVAALGAATDDAKPEARGTLRTTAGERLPPAAPADADAAEPVREPTEPVRAAGFPAEPTRELPPEPGRRREVEAAAEAEAGTGTASGEACPEPRRGAGEPAATFRGMDGCKVSSKRTREQSSEWGGREGGRR